MSCKSGIYAVNPASQTIAIGSGISFGNIVRRFGGNLDLSGGNVVAQGKGYYDIDTNFTLTAGAAGTAVITLYANNVAIPGAVASVLTAEAGIYNINIPAMIRNECCLATTITAVLTGVAGTVNNAAIVAERL